jgi:hypothetical protein
VMSLGSQLTAFSGTRHPVNARKTKIYEIQRIIPIMDLIFRLC